MIKYFRQAFKITNENIILATPLVLFLLLLNIYMEFAKNAPAKPFAVIVLLATILFMISAFFAGWLYMIKKAVDLEKREFLTDEERAKESFDLFKEFPVGIGEYFFSFIGGLILYAFLFVVASVVVFKFGMHFIGNVGLSVSNMHLAVSSSAGLKTVLSSMSAEQLTRLNQWNLLILFSTVLFSFLTLFWFPHIIIKSKNPIKSLFQSMLYILKNPISTIALFIYIYAVHFLASLINAVSVVNQILYFVSMLVYFYFLVYIVVLIFLYYDSESTPKAKDYSNSGTDSIGQEQSGDSEIFDE